MSRLVLMLIAAAVTAASLVSPVSASAQEFDATAVVVKVVDSDTIDVRDDIRGRLRIRTLGIDGPEVKKPGYTVGCGGPEASAFAHEQLLDQRVAIVYDQTQDLHDRYGRTLAYLVKPGGWNYSVEAARAGMVKSFIYNTSPVEKYSEIAAAEQEAKAAGRGLWGPPCNGNTESTPLNAPDSAGGQSAAGTTYYPNCGAARAAGAAPLYAGQPGYRSELDGDGVICSLATLPAA